MDLAVARTNAERMLETAQAMGLECRPHVKTHKTEELALLQTGGRRGRITVSTLAEAEFYADHGFDDIVYAVPITPEKAAAAALSARLDKFVVAVDNEQQVDAPSRTAAQCRGRPRSPGGGPDGRLRIPQG